MANLTNRCPGCERGSCNGCGIYQKLNTNKQGVVSFPEHFQIEPSKGLGISFDVGTTTVAGMLWDLKDGTLLGVETGTNPQAVFGADVVRRIQAAVEDQENLKKMQKLLIEGLDEMAEQLLRSPGGEGNLAGESIKEVTVVGNTAMCEILLGIRPVGLFKAPFVPDYKSMIQVEGDRLGFHFLKEARVIVLPPVGGYVGADALMVYSYVDLKEPDKKILAVDIGTNGEILLKWGSQRYACSTAAGPALEGGAVSQGMRAAKGAVDMVSVSGSFPMQDIAVRVIGEAKPVGICGSGLVDALAVLYRIGVLDHTGYMRSEAEARKKGVSERICKRIAESSEEGCERRFLLTDMASPVYLTAGDVRQLQLSVSAIRCGMEILLKKAGCDMEQLDYLYLAGAFGCYIGIESGIQTGLFPDIPRGKIIQAGNLAGTGAAMALLSKTVRKQMEKEKDKLTHVELAKEREFESLFLAHMNFPLQF